MPKSGDYKGALGRRPATPPGGGVDMLLMLLVGLDGAEKRLSWRELAQLRWRDFELARGGRLMLRGGTLTDEPMFFEGDSVGIIAAAWDGGDLDALVFGGLSISQLNRRGRAAQARAGKFGARLLFYEGDGGGYNDILG